MRNKVKKILIVWLASMGLATLSPSDALAADIDVYLEGAYDDTYLDVYLYADLNVSNVISYGVRVEFLSTQLQVVSAYKNDAKSTYTTNTTEWQLGSGGNKDNPDPLILPNMVVFKGGIVDEAAPTAGVQDPRRVFLGTIRFKTAPENTMPTNPTLVLTYADDYSSSPGSYKNFVRYDASTSGGVVIDSADSTGVNFDSIKIYQRGDASEDGKLDGRDIRALSLKMGLSNLPVWNDCSGEGAIDGRDIRCLLMKL